MKRAKYGPEKIREFKPVSRPQAHVNPKRRKIPEKTRVPKHDMEPFTAKRETAMP